MLLRFLVPARPFPFRQAALAGLVSVLGITGLTATAHAEDGWLFSPYLRADIGYSSTVDDDGDLLETSERDTQDMDPNNGARYQIGVGLKLNSYLRTDITLSYRDSLTEVGAYYDSDGAVKPGNRLDSAAFETSNWSTMINIYVDPLRAAGINTGAFSPYLQGGIGWARNKTDDLVFSADGTRISGETHNDLAWQVGAGVNYAITSQWKLDLSYRFIDMGEARSKSYAVQTNGNKIALKREARFDIQAHEVLLGLQYQF